MHTHKKNNNNKNFFFFLSFFKHWWRFILGNLTNCDDLGITLDDMISPFTYPLLIMFCVMASNMLLEVWEKCGVGYKAKYHISYQRQQSYDISEGRNDGLSVDSGQTETTMRTYSGVGYSSNEQFYNTNHGFILGYLVLMTVLVIIIIFMFDVYSEKYITIAEYIAYCTNLVISILCMVTIPMAMYRMSVLTFKDEEIKGLRSKTGGNTDFRKTRIATSLSKSLLSYTLVALMGFKMMTMIAAYEQENSLIFIDGIVSILMGHWQYMFINWYAFQKRTTTEYHRRTKPGRQELEFLRMCNLSLWLVNTFILKHPASKTMQKETFGGVAWAIISNISQPLTILFYFHSVICLAEVIVHSYSTKYIGLIRAHKLLYKMSHSYVNQNI